MRLRPCSSPNSPRSRRLSPRNARTMCPGGNFDKRPASRRDVIQDVRKSRRLSRSAEMPSIHAVSVMPSSSSSFRSASTGFSKSSNFQGSPQRAKASSPCSKRRSERGGRLPSLPVVTSSLSDSTQASASTIKRLSMLFKLGAAACKLVETRCDSNSEPANPCRRTNFDEAMRTPHPVGLA